MLKRMKLRILYFGLLKDLMGSEGVPLESESRDLPSSFKVADLLQHLRTRRNTDTEVWDSLAVAVNHHYAEASLELHDGDEVALLPPVSGG